MLFVQHTPKNCFSNFVQSAVFARREGDENSTSTFEEETMKLPAENFYDYQISDIQ